MCVCVCVCTDLATGRTAVRVRCAADVLAEVGPGDGVLSQGSVGGTGEDSGDDAGGGDGDGDATRAALKSVITSAVRGLKAAIFETFGFTSTADVDGSSAGSGNVRRYAEVDASAISCSLGGGMSGRPLLEEKQISKPSHKLWKL